MTVPHAANTSVQPSAFLDSNVLVRLFLFWDACRAASLELDMVSGWADLKAALERGGVDADALNRDDGGFVRQGMTSFQRLSAAGPYHLFTSRACWSEAHHVLLEAKGLEQLVRQGVPFSLRVKRPQVLYRSALQQGDYGRLEEDIDEFRESLRFDHHLDVIDVEDLSSGFEVPAASIWEAASAVWSHVLMEVFDAYIYAAAVRIAADLFITADGSLQDALRHLSDPQGDWVALTGSLKSALGLDQSAPLPRPLAPGRDLPNSGTNSI